MDPAKAAALPILGLGPGASMDESNAAWRREAFKYNPNRKPQRAQRMRDLNNARALLLSS